MSRQSSAPDIPVKVTAAGGAITKLAVNAGYHLAFGIGAGFLAAAILVAAIVLRPEVAAWSETADAGETETSEEAA